MAGGGAVVAAAAAARRRRIREIVDAFRLGDATASDRAKSLETLGLSQTGELQDLVVEGVLMPGPREGTYYLSEIGYISRRNDRRKVKAVVIVLIVVAALALILIPMMMANRG